MTIATPGRMPPCGSVTLPPISEVPVCASARACANRETPRIKPSATLRIALSLPSNPPGLPHCLLSVEIRVHDCLTRRTCPHFTAKTQTAPPSGTSGYSPGTSRLMRPCIARASMPHPDCTATYCLPSIANEVGWPMIPELVGNSHSTAPLVASNARNMRSPVPPLNTSPPPVVRIGPQLIEPGNGRVHVRLPVSTFHPCTSPT